MTHATKQAVCPILASHSLHTNFLSNFLALTFHSTPRWRVHPLVTFNIFTSITFRIHHPLHSSAIHPSFSFILSQPSYKTASILTHNTFHPPSHIQQRLHLAFQLFLGRLHLQRLSPFLLLSFLVSPQTRLNL